MKNIKVVAFDCDGVMFDTVKANTAYYNSVLNHFGRPDMTPEQFAYSHMHTADDAMAYLFDDEKMLEAAQNYRKNMSYLPFLKYMEIESYLKPLLKKLRPKYRTAVATNRTDTMKRVIIEHTLEGCFDIVVTALDVKRPKPHPDELLKILEHFQIEPQQAIYVGDSELDVIAAKSAGIPIIAYNNKSLSANFHINSLKEIEDILEI
ncbi:MAG: HAD-IA family hydrolase [Deltaproteobacteria bacterium]|nr:HAD-IA family hydrolase [Deltaproteobacteria bacterium]MBW2662812.1 HAD-IA family hydrolase [Deltaproteobacteria bacterium]